jgi:subtilase family serine protease
MRRSALSLSNLSTVILCILLFSTFSFAAAPDRIAGPVVAQQPVKLSASVPHRAEPQFDRGPVDPSLKLSSMTVLTVPSASQQKALDRLLAQQQDPRSPQYHKWLTPEQYGDRFGLSPNDIKKITTWLQSQGFSIKTVARGRNWVSFSGTAAQAESAFQTSLHTFDLNGEAHFSNTTPLSIPAALSGAVVGVRGLSNFHPKPHSRQVKPSPDYTTASGSLFLAPGDIATMYDVTPLYGNGIDGTGQTLAVIGETDVYLADLVNFRSGFGLSAISGCTTNANLVITACDTANFKYVVAAGDVDPGLPNSIQDDLAEADIDIEWSGAVARNAQITYVNAPVSGVFAALYHAIDNSLSPVATLSYGLCEIDEGLFVGPDEAELQKANSLGITVLNSSGDSGAAECDYTSSPATRGISVSYPASSPSVTGVGGTLIPFNEYTSTFWKASNDANGGSALSYIPEYGWNDPQDWGGFCAAKAGNCSGFPFSDWPSAQSFFGILAGGGGVSNCTSVNGGGACQGGFPKPSYQSGLTGLVLSGQAPARYSPDVSLLASIYFPGFIVCTAQSEIGGTGSASSCANGIPTAVVCSGNGLCSVFGGTSVASPMFAGVVTLLNQSLNGTGSQGLGNINPTLYSLAKTPGNGAFHQVITGSNGAFCVVGTPAGQPAVLQCPAAGFFGFDASNFDPTTHYNLVTGLGSVDANLLATAWAAGRTASSMTFTALPGTAILGQTVTLTATMSPSSASGTVSFFVNGSSTALGSAVLSSGVAILTTTSLPVGTDSIVAQFPGDGYNQPSSGNASVTVAAPDFTLTNTGVTTATVLAGVPGTGYSFNVTPAGGAGSFVETVNFSCPGLDTTIICVFSPASIPAGTPGVTSVPVSLTITTSGPNTSGARLQKRADNRAPWLPFTLPIAGVVMVGLAGRKWSKYSTVAGLGVALVLIGLLIACGSSSAPVAVSAITPGAASLYPNNAGWPSSTQAFSATVTGSSNTAVTWSISPSPAGASIDASGLFTAPTIAANLPATITVTATSQADTTKTKTATVALKPATVPGAYPVTITVTESPTTHTLPVSITVQ